MGRPSGWLLAGLVLTLSGSVLLVAATLLFASHQIDMHDFHTLLGAGLALTTSGQAACHRPPRTRRPAPRPPPED